MRSICFIRTDYGLLTGATNATLMLAQALEDEGFEVHLLSIYKSVPEPANAFGRLRHSYLNSTGSRLRHGFFAATRKLRSYLKENSIDIVCSVCMSPGLLVLLASLGMPVKTILIEHSNRLNLIEYNESSNRFLHMIARRFDRVIVLTKAEVKNYTSIFKVKPERITVIPNWISEKALGASEEYSQSSRRLISVGNVGPVKGYNLLLEVAQQLKQKLADWHWDIYGGDDADGSLQSQIEAAQLNDAVALWGYDPDILHRYKGHAVFVMTSYYEGLPLSLLEARANHLPAVAFDCPTGPCEVIRDGVDGFLIPCYEVDIMTERLMELMQDVELRQRFSDACEAQIKKFSKDMIFAQWLKLFREL